MPVWFAGRVMTAPPSSPKGAVMPRGASSLPVAVFHPGTQHSWQTALALQELHRLAWYATSIYHQPERWPYRLESILPSRLAQPLAARFRRFSQPGLDPALVRTAGVLEWAERLAGMAGAHSLSRRLDAVGNRRFGQALQRDLAGPERFALWGYNGSSREAFVAAKRAGRSCILDRTNGDWRAYNAVMEEVAEDYPEWFLPLERRIPQRQIDRDDDEYGLADVIVCGAPFPAETIRTHAADPSVTTKLRVLPYSFNAALFANVPPPKPTRRDKPIKFLFLGLAIPRKGIHHVLEAIQRLPATVARLTVVGQLGIPRDVLARYEDRIDYLPTVPRSEVPAIMAAHEVLLLPSYFEGSALTLLEGLAAGMAIIQTHQAGLGATERTGVVLERPGTDALHAAMMLAIEDRDRLDGWRAAAQLAAQAYSFERYRGAIAALLDDLDL
jgi:glycosyltransferase involved in cell wall biosynthesis